jgi:hypothetical protein
VPDTLRLLSAVKAAWESATKRWTQCIQAVPRHSRTNRHLRRGLFRLLAQPSEGPGGVKQKKISHLSFATNMQHTVYHCSLTAQDANQAVE